jgi:hypothetical protein
MGQPTGNDVHTDKTISERPSRAYLKRMFANLKKVLGDPLSIDVWKAAVKDARAHAGGAATAAKRKAMPKATAELIKFEQALRADEPAVDDRRES